LKARSSEKRKGAAFMSDFSQLFLYIPGIIIFLIGSGGVRTWLGMKRLGAFAETTVISSQHVIKKDRQDREVFNYYNTVVEYVDAKTGRTVRKTVKARNRSPCGNPVRHPPLRISLARLLYRYSPILPSRNRSARSLFPLRSIHRSLY
jgi:hypothetical protein